jgi:hypothetical protein
MFGSRKGYPPKRPGRGVKSRKGGGSYQAGYEAALRDLKGRGTSERAGARGGRRRKGVGARSPFGELRVGHRM